MSIQAECSHFHYNLHCLSVQVLTHQQTDHHQWQLHLCVKEDFVKKNDFDNGGKRQYTHRSQKSHIENLLLHIQKTSDNEPILPTSVNERGKLHVRIIEFILSTHLT